MARLSIEQVEESRRLNWMIRQNGMRDTVRTIMQEKDLDCPGAKRYINKNR